MKKTSLLLGAALLALGVLAETAAAREPVTFRARSAKLAEDIAFGDKALININNLTMWFKRDGYSAGDPATDASGVTYPRSTDQAIYRDGLVWGGKVIDGDAQVLRVGGSTYAQGCVPGRIVSQGVAANRNDPTVRIFRVRRDFRTADLTLEASEYLTTPLADVTAADVEAIRAQYQKDWNEWPAAWGAPFYDRNGNGTYEPSVDEPGVANADQVAWFVINDLDEGASMKLYGAKPIGIECQVLLWGYARTDALGQAIFKKYSVIYKGTEDSPADARIDSMYFAQWSDPDLGDSGDDFVGCDVDLSLGYVYNSTDADANYQAYGLAPPAAGYDFLQGPVVPDETSEAIFNFQKLQGFRNLPMTAFVYFAAGSSIDDPELNSYIGTQEWYNLLRGFEPQPDVANPTAYTDPYTGANTTFTMSGDPVRATGWNDGVPLPPGDRRLVMATGPFTMALGDTQEVVVALLGGISTDRLRSVSQLKFNDQFVQDAYNSLFAVPKPPAQPSVRVSPLDGAIVLDWGWDPAAVAATEGDDGSGFVFEGYNLYQLPSANASLAQATRVSTYDLENGVATILGIDLDQESGVILDVPLQIGSDAGVRRYLKLTRDAIRGGPLVNGQEYYFAVTAYNRNTEEGAATTTLESPALTRVCVPQPARPGSRYGVEAEQTIDADHASGISDGGVRAIVVDPARTTGKTYKVTFQPDGDGGTAWRLADNRTNVQLAVGAQLPSVDESGEYIGSDAIEVRVAGPPLGMKSWDIPSGERWWTWASAGWDAEGFGTEYGLSGAITGDIDNQWFSPTTLAPGDLRTVEIRFTSVDTVDGENQYKPLDPNNENVSWAYRYLRRPFDDPPALADMTSTTRPWDVSKYLINPDGDGYPFQDRVPICLSAWDVDSNPPRRLEVGFLENNVPGGLVNGAYGPAFNGLADNVAAGGPREWLFVFGLPYTDPRQGANSEILRTSGLTDQPLPHMWIVFASRRRDLRFPQDGDTFLMVANHVNTAADKFTFTVPATQTSDSLAKADVKLINVFPNPYYGVNDAESSPYQKFVTFSHLPKRATIRIYDLSGTLVRRIDKNDAEQFVRWDLLNHGELPVASGIYIAHIDLPTVGKTRILKLAVVQEQQYLENY